LLASPAYSAITSLAGTSLLILLLVACAAIVTVTIVALVRADKQDIPQVFGSFAAAFGFRKTTPELPGRVPQPAVESPEARENR
jgi:hypothetical protein